VGHGDVGPGRRRGRGASEKGGEKRKPLAAAGDPLSEPEGEGLTAPVPMPVRGGQRGGVDGDEKGLHA